ncbi:MAG: hypothetical protein U1F43_29085 [Myxococcota bacterium]
MHAAGIADHGGISEGDVHAIVGLIAPPEAALKAYGASERPRFAWAYPDPLRASHALRCYRVRCRRAARSSSPTRRRASASRRPSSTFSARSAGRIEGAAERAPAVGGGGGRGVQAR